MADKTDPCVPEMASTEEHAANDGNVQTVADDTLSEKEQMFLDYIAKHQPISREELQSHFKMNKREALDIINILKELKKILTDGAGPKTAYILKS